MSERIDPIIAEAYRIGEKQLGEDEFIARVESTITAIQALLKERHANDPQGVVISLVAAPPGVAP